ncbi:unnamed protein product [Camellia sinensis]
MGKLVQLLLLCQSPILGTTSQRQTFILGLFSKRSSRERPKPKGQVWRRSLVDFFICFMVGVFFGLTPFAMNLPVNLMSRHQGFSFELVPSLENVQWLDAMPRNATPLVDSSLVNDNATLWPQVMKLELQNGTSDDTHVTQSLNKDWNMALYGLLIIVTPTYAQPFQAYYLNRLSAETANILRRNSVMYRHLVCNKNLTDIKDRSVHQRNVALTHIEMHRLDGIVYFADDDNIYSVDLIGRMRQINDDNIYSVDLIGRMRQIRHFGTWTVTKLVESNSRAILEGPICNGTRVIGWHTNEVSRRFWRFHAEMSGFAFYSTILWDPKQWHRPTLEPIRQLDTVNEGIQVSTFMEQVVEDESQMECLPQNCSRIMIWHLHVESSFSYPPEWFLKYNNQDIIAPLA